MPNAGFSYGLWTQKTIGYGSGLWGMRNLPMSNLPRLSTPSASCLLDWRPSRQERMCLWLLTGLAAFSLLRCDLPAALAWPAAGLALLGGGCTLRHSARCTPREFVLTPDLNTCRLDGEPLSQLDLRWRGPLLFVRFKHPAQCRWRHLVFWPDTLPAAKRRELRLLNPMLYRTMSPRPSRQQQAATQET